MRFVKTLAVLLLAFVANSANAQMTMTRSQRFSALGDMRATMFDKMEEAQTAKNDAKADIDACAGMVDHLQELIDGIDCPDSMHKEIMQGKLDGLKESLSTAQFTYQEAFTRYWLSIVSWGTLPFYYEEEEMAWMIFIMEPPSTLWVTWYADSCMVEFAIEETIDCAMDARDAMNNLNTEALLYQFQCFSCDPGFGGCD